MAVVHLNPMLPAPGEAGCLAFDFGGRLCGHDRMCECHIEAGSLPGHHVYSGVHFLYDAPAPGTPEWLTSPSAVIR